MVKQDPWMIKILKYLYNEGVAHTADVARGVHIATTTAHKYLNKLVEEGFVTVQRAGAGKPVFWELVESNLRNWEKDEEKRLEPSHYALWAWIFQEYAKQKG